MLISPFALGDINTEKQDIAINLTKKQIEGSPSLETDKPVSRQFEEDYYGSYGWPLYWGGPYMWALIPTLSVTVKCGARTMTVENRGISTCGAAALQVPTTSRPQTAN